MSIINASVWTATNTTQDLFTITNPIPGVPQYNAIGPEVPLVFNFVQTNIGNDIEIDKETGNISLKEKITYQIQVLADITGDQGLYQIQLGETGDPVSPASPGGFTLVTTITPDVDSVYQIKVFTNSGRQWRYPSQVLNTSVTVTAVSGFESDTP